MFKPNLLNTSSHGRSLIASKYSFLSISTPFDRKILARGTKVHLRLITPIELKAWPAQHGQDRSIPLKNVKSVLI